MRPFFKTALVLTALGLLLGCSGSKEPKAPKEVPERLAVVVFKNTTSIQVKNSLMGACSQDRLFIQPTLTEITCVRHTLNQEREQMLLTVVNDSFARRITDNVRFVLTPEGRDVRVVGHAFVQYVSPLSVTIDGEIAIKSVNLLDNNSFSLLEKLLQQAAGTSP